MPRYLIEAAILVEFEADEDSIAMRLPYRIPKQLKRLPGVIHTGIGELHLRSEDGALELRMNKPDEDDEEESPEPAPTERRRQRRHPNTQDGVSPAA